MAVMDIKMIICDLDQTLLRSDKTVSDYTLKTLNKCRLKGIKFGVATARSNFGAGVFTNLMEPDVMIYNGGAAAIIDGKKIYCREMDIELTRLLAQKILDAGFGFSAEGDLGYFYRYDNPITHYLQILIEHGQRIVFVESAECIDTPVSKITATLDMDFAKSLVADFPHLDIITYHGEPWVRIALKEATKWQAVAAAASHLGINTAYIAAFGDDYNDVEMLEKCGVGVAMSNAIPEALAVADFIAASNDEDGVARWLEENILLYATPINC